MKKKFENWKFLAPLFPFPPTFSIPPLFPFPPFSHSCESGNLPVFEAGRATHAPHRFVICADGAGIGRFPLSREWKGEREWKGGAGRGSSFNSPLFLRGGSGGDGEWDGGGAVLEAANCAALVQNSLGNRLAPFVGADEISVQIKLAAAGRQVLRETARIVVGTMLAAGDENLRLAAKSALANIALVIHAHDVRVLFREVLIAAAGGFDFADIPEIVDGGVKFAATAEVPDVVFREFLRFSGGDQENIAGAHGDDGVGGKAGRGQVGPGKSNRESR